VNGLDGREDIVSLRHEGPAHSVSATQSDCCRPHRSQPIPAVKASDRGNVMRRGGLSSSLEMTRQSLADYHPSRRRVVASRKGDHVGRVGANIFGFRLLIKLSILVAASSISLIASRTNPPRLCRQGDRRHQPRMTIRGLRQRRKKTPRIAAGTTPSKARLINTIRALVDQSDLPREETYPKKRRRTRKTRRQRENRHGRCRQEI